MIQPSHMAAYKLKIDATLKHIICDIQAHDQTIEQLISYTIFSGGKRIRALLAVMLYELLDGTEGDIYICASALEMIHTATLMLDDLPCMDDSDYRRDKLASHKAFDVAHTILGAFGLASQAMSLLSNPNYTRGIEPASVAALIHDLSRCRA